MRYLERNRVDDPVHTNMPDKVDLFLGLRTTQFFNLDWNFVTSGRFALEDHVWEGEFSFDRSEGG